MNAERVRANLARVRGQIERAAAAGRDPAEVEILAATKYVAREDLPTARRGRHQARRREPRAGPAREGRAPAGCRWDFIGQLQAAGCELIVPHVRLIHSVASESALRELERHPSMRQTRARGPDRGQRRRRGGQGRDRPAELDAYLARSPVRVGGLMTMPPLAGEPEQSRRWFAALRELAAERGLAQLSMGTTQDYESPSRRGRRSCGSARAVREQSPRDAAIEPLRRRSAAGQS